MMPVQDYTIDCTGDAVSGDEIIFAEAVFGGTVFRPKFLGHRVIEGKILRDSYGAKRQQHTFTILVTNSEGVNPIEPGKIILRKGRNVYRYGTYRKPWPDESQREVALEEKHYRGDLAREERYFRELKEWQEELERQKLEEDLKRIEELLDEEEQLERKYAFCTPFTLSKRYFYEQL